MTMSAIAKQGQGSNKTVLIVGASGFIGSYLIEEALARGYITIAGIRKQTNQNHLQGKLVHIVEFDYQDKEKLNDQLQLLKKEYGVPNYIIYNIGITKSASSDGFHKANFLLLQQFIESLLSQDYIPDKFIYMSSLSVMGAGDENNFIPFKESDTPNPCTKYGQSKLNAEKYIRSLTHFPYIILRPTGVYGPRDKDFLLIVKAIEYGINIRIGLRPQQLSFIYVKDLARLVFLALESNLENKAYLVSDGNSYTGDDFSSLVKKQLNKKHTINICIPLCIIKIISSTSTLLSKLTRQPSIINNDKYIILKQRNWLCDTTQVKNDFGFAPEYNLEKGVTELIKSYKKCYQPQ